MSLLAIFCWSILIALFAIGSALYVRKSGRPDALMAAYVTFVIIANIAAAKTIVFDLGFASFFAPGGVLVFAVTFLLSDIVNEQFGRKETQRMIYIALFAQIALIAFMYLVVSATPAPFYTNQAAFAAILGSVPRITIAGLVTFFVSETLDAYLYSWFKVLTKGKNLWMRNVFSSVPSMLVDSALFVTLAFYGIMPLLPLIIGLTVVKWVVGVIDIPFMYLARGLLRRS
jgi:uncharacterized integral membrane protein (TIGR00697 family)